MFCATGTFLILAAATVAAEPASRSTPTASPVLPLRLQDPRGAWHEVLAPKGDSKLVVLAFLGTECPLAELYASRLAELARSNKDKGVAFVGIDANSQDSASSLLRFATTHDLPFPLLKDVGNKVADHLQAARTPEVFVLDGQCQIRYHGRIDDQFGFGVHRPAPTRHDLSTAIEELLVGKPVTTPVTDAVGCRIGRLKEPAGRGKVTYSKEVARILRDRCVSCHREGEIAPFALTSYAQAAGWADTIAEVVRDRRMPPWHASPEHGRFANEARLSDDELRQIATWVDDGAPEGDPRDLPEPARYAEGWRIPKPDLVVDMPRSVEIPAEGTLPYQNFVVDPKLRSDVWVRASQVRPGNPSVVHHLVVFVLPPGRRDNSPEGFDFLAAYAPGMPPRVYPEGLAKLVPAGSRLLLQVHYTPRGVTQTDRSQIGLVFADAGSIRKQMTSILAMNNRLRIPPGAPDYRAEAAHRFDQDTILYSILPHMHLRGKSMRVDAVYPDHRREVLLDVPRYEFEWQNTYVLAEPKLMPEGTVLQCVGHFDNSADNLSNPDPKATVTWGEQTRDEMLVGYVETALADQDFSAGEPAATRKDDGRYEVVFRHRPPAGTKAVYLAGTFSDWKPSALKLDGPDASGEFVARVDLEAGRYEYKFVLEGTRWRADPGNRRQAGFYHNSVIEVGSKRP